MNLGGATRLEAAWTGVVGGRLWRARRWRKLRDAGPVILITCNGKEEIPDICWGWNYFCSRSRVEPMRDPTWASQDGSKR